MKKKSTFRPLPRFPLSPPLISDGALLIFSPFWSPCEGRNGHHIGKIAPLFFALGISETSVAWAMLKGVGWNKEGRKGTDGLREWGIMRDREWGRLQKKDFSWGLAAILGPCTKRMRKEFHDEEKGVGTFLASFFHPAERNLIRCSILFMQILFSRSWLTGTRC